MNFFRWRNRRPEVQTKRSAFQFTEETAEEDLFDAATVLLDLEENRDLGETLVVLDSCLEQIQQQGKERKVHQLVAWVEEEFRQRPAGPHQLARLAAVYQRLEEGDRSACLHRALGLSREALRRYREAGARQGEAIVLNNMGIVCNELGASSPQFFQDAIPLLEEALRFYEEENETDCQVSICMASEMPMPGWRSLDRTTSSWRWSTTTASGLCADAPAQTRTSCRRGTPGRNSI